jgi:hypothetical protein
MARMHHVALHGRGVASGLVVSVQEAGMQVEVGPGVAVNGKGELIALSAEGQANVGEDRPVEAGQQIDPPFRLGTAGRESGTHYLCIQFAQALRFTEGACGKLEQTPWLRMLPATGNPGPIEAGEAIVLAIVEVDAEGIATVRDRAEGLAHRRQLVGPVMGELRIRRTDTASEAVADTPAGRIAARDGGGLRLTLPDAGNAMTLDREDGGRFSRLEVHADVSRLSGKLEVLGGLELASRRLQAGGSEADPTLDVQLPADKGSLNVRNASGTHEVMLGIDEGGGLVSTMTEHDLRLGVGGDKTVMTIKADGRVGIGAPAPGERLDVEGRIKTGRLTLGDWPADPSNAFFGNNTLDQNDPVNYALLQFPSGLTFLNSPLRIDFRLGNSLGMQLANEGLGILRNVGIFIMDPQFPIHLRGGAHCTGTQWREASSISCKSNVKTLCLDDALEALSILRPVTFKYIGDGEARAGFIAEEVPDLLATGDRTSLSPMEIVAVLTRVVQLQQRQIHELSERLGSRAGHTGSAELEPGPPQPCTARV